MKTSFLLLLFFAFGAGHLAAQTSPLNPSLRNPVLGKNPPAPARSPVISYWQSPYEIHGDRFIYGGAAIELYQAKNPIKLLQPSRQPQTQPTLADRLWDERRPEGMSVLSFKF